jgi:hypothetical protein
MHHPIFAALETLSRKGIKTSEGQLTIAGFGLGTLVICFQIVQQLAGLPMQEWIVLVAVVLIGISVVWYNKSRAGTKASVATLLAEPEVVELLKKLNADLAGLRQMRPDAKTKPASTPEIPLIERLGALESLKPEPRALKDRSGALSAPLQPLAPYTVVIQKPGEPKRVEEFIEREAACLFADDFRKSPDCTLGTKVHVL